MPSVQQVKVVVEPPAGGAPEEALKAVLRLARRLARWLGLVLIGSVVFGGEQ